MKLIDPIDIKNQVKNGELRFYIEDGYVYCADNSCTVIVGEINTEPVRHGCEHCKDGTYHGQVLMLCNDNATRMIKYCPSCGTKMYR